MPRVIEFIILIFCIAIAAKVVVDAIRNGNKKGQ